jgi:hypothetical protein
MLFLWMFSEGQVAGDWGYGVMQRGEAGTECAVNS